MKRSKAPLLLTSIVEVTPIDPMGPFLEPVPAVKDVTLDMMFCATKVFNGLLFHAEKKQKRYKWKVPPNDLHFLNQVLHRLPRKRGLHSLVAQGVRDEVHEAIASHIALLHNGRTQHNSPKGRKKGSYSNLTYVMGNGCHLEEDVLRLSCGVHRQDGVREVQFQVHTHPGAIPFTKIQSVELVYDTTTGRFFAHLSGIPPMEQPFGDTDNPRRASVDLGMKVLAALQVEEGPSLLFSAGLLRSTQYYWMKVRQSLQAPNAEHQASRRWRQVRRRESRQIDHLLHIISKALVAQLWLHGVTVLTIGDITGILQGKDWGREANKYLHAWPFAKLVSYITYKCKLQGITVLGTDERDTSRTCHACRKVCAANRKTRGSYECSCGWKCHADVNGSSNIFQKAFGVSPFGSTGCVAQPAMLGTNRHTVELRRLHPLDATGCPVL